MTLAVRKRKRTCPSFAASRNARTSRTGRTTSWIHRGIWIVGPGPAIRGSYRRALAGARRETLLRSPAMATPRTRHAARLSADRRRAQARARRFAIVAMIGVLAVVTLALTAFDSESSPTVSRPAPLPVTSAPPDPQVLATVGNLRVRVSRRAGRSHGHRVPRKRRRRARAESRRPAARTRGCSRDSGVGSLARPGAASRGTSSRAVRSARSTWAPSPERTSTRPSTGPSWRFEIRSSPGNVVGAEIELRPTSAPSLVVSMQNVRP